MTAIDCLDREKAGRPSGGMRCVLAGLATTVRVLALGAGLVLAGTQDGAAQEVGESAADVKTRLGNPSASRKTAKGEEIWVYENGTKVTFRDGAVIHVLDSSGRTFEEQEERYSAVKIMTADGEAIEPPAPTQKAPARGSGDEPETDADADAEFDRSYDSLPLFAKVILTVAALTAVAASIMIVIAAFKESVWWGLGYLFIPFVSLIFIFTRWDKVWKPVLTMAGCWAVCFVLVGALA